MQAFEYTHVRTFHRYIIFKFKEIVVELTFSHCHFYFYQASKYSFSSYIICRLSFKIVNNPQHPQVFQGLHIRNGNEKAECNLPPFRDWDAIKTPQEE